MLLRKIYTLSCLPENKKNVYFSNYFILFKKKFELYKQQKKSK